MIEGYYWRKGLHHMKVFVWEKIHWMKDTYMEGLPELDLGLESVL
jgi:hypothetical protein